jgi:hypothetical protein
MPDRFQTFAFATRWSPPVVVVGLHEVGQDPEKALRAAAEHYLAEHEEPDGFTWAHLGKVPSTYFTAAGLMNVLVQEANLLSPEPLREPDDPAAADAEGVRRAAAGQDHPPDPAAAEPGAAAATETVRRRMADQLLHEQVLQAWRAFSLQIQAGPNTFDANLTSVGFDPAKWGSGLEAVVRANVDAVRERVAVEGAESVPQALGDAVLAALLFGVYLVRKGA